MKYNKMPSEYGIIQTEVMRDPSISVYAKAIYSLLCSMKDESNHCILTQEEIAKYMGIQRGTAFKYIKELSEKNLIKKSKLYQDMRQNIRYEILLTNTPM